MTKKHFFIVFLFNFLLALAFYIQGLSANVTDISGDLANIIPICKKIDNPNLFQSDLYLGDINNVKYYTPFYVETLRFFAKFTNYNYVQALNILGFITHFLYGLLWFLLFYKLRKDFWVAFIFSIFFRGIVWPPGMELLGISDIWSIMPRTIFIALIPLPFLIYQQVIAVRQFLAALTLGLLVNFHPISGIGCILTYFSLHIFYLYLNNNLFVKASIIKLCLFFILVFIGMLPYIISYLGNVKSVVNVNQRMFDIAFKGRLDSIFFDSILFLKSWFRPVTGFFAAGMLVFYFFDTSKHKKTFKIIFFTIIVLLLFCNAIIPLESFINSNCNTNFRFSFQIVRAQKFVLVLLQIATFLAICLISEKFKIADKVKIAVCILYLVIISLSTSALISKLPLFGEDITTFIFPNNLKVFPVLTKDKSEVLAVHDFVNKNTKKTDIFYAQDIFFRTATNRAEVFDFHAAGMLIEGNPLAYTNFYFLLQKFKKSDEREKIKILQAKKVNYIIVQEKWQSLLPVYRNDKYFVYKL